jgi:hypothetical protein|tara:strand:- start:73 stop:381 length:309 start_codon:yes stop_codon:yes gene_type:complete
MIKCKACEKEKDEKEFTPKHKQCKKCLLEKNNKRRKEKKKLRDDENDKLKLNLIEMNKKYDDLIYGQMALMQENKNLIRENMALAKQIIKAKKELKQLKEKG